jgi:hypothetical protein
MDFATKLYHRLSTTEKLKLRAATIGAVDYLAQTEFLFDLVSLPKEERLGTMLKVQSLVDEAWKSHAASDTFGRAPLLFLA